MHWSRALLPTALLLAAVAGCSDSPTSPPRPPTLVVVHAPPALGLPDLPFLDTIVVQAVNPKNGNPRSGVPITWVVSQGGGTVVVIDSVTDAGGLARAQWFLGAAGANALQAHTAEDSTVTVAATAGAFTADLLVSGIYSACGLRSGVAWCWGEGYGADAAGPSDRRRGDWANTSPVPVTAPAALVDLSLSGNSLCGLDQAGTTYCADSGSTSLSAVAGLPALSMLAAASEGHVHCGLTRADSTAWCFVPDSAAPAAVPDSVPFLDIRLEQWDHFYEVCGIKVDSTVACWSTGFATQGFSLTHPTTDLPSSPKVIELARGRGFGCGRTATNDIYCWGSLALGLKPYSPALADSGVATLGAFDDWVQLLPSLLQWSGFNELTPANPYSAPTGLGGLPLLDYGKNSLNCLRTTSHEVYCLDRFFSGTQVLSLSEYGPVEPAP